MVALSIEIHGMDVALARIGRLANVPYNTLLRQIGLAVEEQTVAHFQQQAGPDGAWAPTNRGGQILVDTGTLRGSIDHAVHGSDSVEIGTRVHYGKYHQLGTKKMPSRAFIGLTDSDRDEVQEVCLNFINRMMD